MPDYQEYFLAIGIIVGLLSIVHNKVYLDKFVEYHNWIEEAIIHVELPYFSPGFFVLDLFGSIVVCFYYRLSIQTKKTWYESLLSCMIILFGGAITTGLILGQAPSYLLSNDAVPSLLIIWWLTFCSPFDIYWKFVYKYESIIITISHFIHTIASGLAITSWGVDKALNNVYHLNSHEYGNSVVLCILCGISTSSLGSFLAEWLGVSHKYVQSGKYSTLNRSVVLSTFYFIMVDHNNSFGVLSRPIDISIAHVSITSLQLINFIIQYIWPDIDIFDYLTSSVLKLLLIPSFIEPTKIKHD